MKTVKELLSEKRKNPKINKKIGTFARLEQYKGRNDIFISYTEKNKIGINPKSEFDTPIGIYTYPLAQIWSEIAREKDASKVPYAGKNPYIQVLKLNGRGTFVQDLHTKYTKSMYDKDMDALKKMDTGKLSVVSKNDQLGHKATVEGFKYSIKLFKRKTSDELDGSLATDMYKILKKLELEIDRVDGPIKDDREYLVNSYKTWSRIQTLCQDIVALVEDDFQSFTYNARTSVADAQTMRSMFYFLKDQETQTVEDSIRKGSNQARFQSWGGKFWNVTRWVSCNNRDPEMHTSKRTIVKWNKILRDLGYAGFADRSGKGIIHPNEPKQAIFLATKYFDHIDTIDNKKIRIPVKANTLKDAIEPDRWWQVKDNMKNIVDDINGGSWTNVAVTNPREMPKLIFDHLKSNKSNMKMGFNSGYLFIFLGYTGTVKSMGRLFSTDVLESLIQQYARGYDMLTFQMLSDFKKMGFSTGTSTMDKIFMTWAKQLKLSLAYYPKSNNLKDKMMWLKEAYENRFNK